MTSVGVSTLIPHQAVIEMPKSTSKHVLRRRQVEILPLESSSFSYGVNDSIKFNISSSTELLDGMNSYIKMGLQCSGNDDRALDVGGAHSLFREISLMTQNGTLIQRYERYNRWYAMMSNATHSPQHVELVEASAGDSVSTFSDISIPYRSAVVNAGVQQNATYVIANASFATAGRLFSLGVGSLAGEFAVGDTVLVGIAAASYYAKITVLDNDVDDAVQFTIGAVNVFNNVPAANIVAPDLVALAVVRANVNLGNARNYQSQRARVAQQGTADPYGSGVPLMWKPAVSFLQMKQWIPLAFIKQGLHLEMKLDRPEYVLNRQISVEQEAAAVGNDGLALDFTIYSPRYVAMMITPDESIMAEYLKQFNGQGIHMSILGYRHHRQNVSYATSSAVINHMYGVRSARHVFSVIQGANISETVGASCRTNFSLSTYLRSFCDEYQYKSGSEEFPQRRVECDDYSTEAFAQLMLATNQHGGTLWNVRFNPSEWQSVNDISVDTSGNAGNTSTFNNRSTKFIMATRLDRNDDNFTGLDLSLNPLDLELSFSANDDISIGNRIVHSWVGHDILVSLSADGLIVRK